MSWLQKFRKKDYCYLVASIFDNGNFNKETVQAVLISAGVDYKIGEGDSYYECEFYVAVSELQQAVKVLKEALADREEEGIRIYMWGYK